MGEGNKKLLLYFLRNHHLRINMEAINYSHEHVLSREEKIQMYSKLSKREIIEMLLDNQRLVERFTSPSDVMPVNYPDNPPGTWHNLPSIWHGINHPLTGDPLYPTFTTSIYQTGDHVGNL